MHILVSLLLARSLALNRVGIDCSDSCNYPGITAEDALSLNGRSHQWVMNSATIYGLDISPAGTNCPSPTWRMYTASTLPDFNRQVTPYISSGWRLSINFSISVGAAPDPNYTYDVEDFELVVGTHEDA